MPGRVYIFSRVFSPDGGGGEIFIFFLFRFISRLLLWPRAAFDTPQAFPRKTQLLLCLLWEFSTPRPLPTHILHTCMCRAQKARQAGSPGPGSLRAAHYLREPLCSRSSKTRPPLSPVINCQHHFWMHFIREPDSCALRTREVELARE